MTEPRPPDNGGEQRRGRRRGKRTAATGWLPGGNRRPDGFLPPLPRHTETGVMRGLSDEELAKIGVDPRKLRRRKRLASRTFVAFLIRWRYFVTASVALFVAVSLVATALILLRDAFNDPNKLPTQAAPTLEELNNSIALGQRYIESLYKPLPNGEAVQSEASGVPFRVHFLDEDKWVLLGEDTGPSTALGHVHDSATSDDYTVSFSSPTTQNALTVHVQINWTFSPTQYQIRITPTGTQERAELWLDDTELNTYAPGGNPKTVAYTFDDKDQSRLRMLRFTVRHATQEAYLYWNTYGHDPLRAAALKKFLEDNDYTAGFDLRAPLYNANADLPDDLPVDDMAYPDCAHVVPGDRYQAAYAYHSKVCLYEGLYIDTGDRDPFLQAWDALTVLMKYKDPNHEQPEWGWWTEGGTPSQVSVTLRGQWNRTGWGVPKCTPFSCAELSGIRTSVFGALETQLGYVYGDPNAQKFADAAASVITMAQVGMDGKIRADNGVTYTRPAQVGSYLGAWLPPDLRFTQPSTPKVPVAIALLLRGASPTPLEYQGLVPSNSETSLDALGFLMMYRCQKYHQGC